MGIKLIAREWKAGSVECRNEYICDTDADFDNLPQAPVGSRAISLWSKKERAVNTKGIWKPYGENFVGAPILSLTKGTGVGEVTEVVTAESDFSHDLSVALGDFFGLYDAYRIDCPIGDIDTTSLVVEGKVHCDKPYKITFRSVNGEETSLYLNDDGNNEIGLALYFYTALLLKAENNDKVFAVVVPDNLKELLIAAGVPEDQIDAGLALLGDSIPPNTILIPKTLFEGEEAFASVSVTYEGETEVTVFSVTDTNDEGIVASYEVYADDALVDTVPKAETIDATALGVTAGASVTVKAKSIIDTTSEASNAVIF